MPSMFMSSFVTELCDVTEHAIYYMTSQSKLIHLFVHNSTIGSLIKQRLHGSEGEFKPYMIV